MLIKMILNMINFNKIIKLMKKNFSNNNKSKIIIINKIIIRIYKHFINNLK